MPTSIALTFIVLGLVACEPPAPKHKPEKFVAHKHVADLTMTLPAGFEAHYNAITDSWRFASPDTTVVFERTPEASTAGPDAFRQYLGIKAELVKRQGINDGFIATFDDGEM